MQVRGDQCRAQRPAGIAGCGLDPDAFEYPLALQPAIGHAVQRHTAGQAQLALARAARNASRQLEHHLLGDRLHRGRQVHLALAQLGFGQAGRAAEQPLEPLVDHGQAGAIVKIVEIEAKCAVVLDIDQMPLDGVGKARRAIGRQAHQLVLAGIDLEPGVLGKCRIQQPKRMRKMNFAQYLQASSFADGQRSGRPFTHAV